MQFGIISSQMVRRRIRSNGCERSQDHVLARKRDAGPESDNSTTMYSVGRVGNWRGSCSGQADQAAPGERKREREVTATVAAAAASDLSACEYVNMGI